MWRAKTDEEGEEAGHCAIRKWLTTYTHVQLTNRPARARAPTLSSYCPYTAAADLTLKTRKKIYISIIGIMSTGHKKKRERERWNNARRWFNSALIYVRMSIERERECYARAPLYIRHPIYVNPVATGRYTTETRMLPMMNVTNNEWIIARGNKWTC